MADVQDFDEINVQRINLREPDGRLRYVLANSARLPGIIVRGKEFRPHRSAAGMIFYSDEETESGGLVFTGSEGTSGGALSFDAYEQDQIVQVIGYSGGGATVEAGLVVNDMPGYPRDFGEVEEIRARPDADEVFAEKFAEGVYGRRRVFVGVQGGDAILDLRDGLGRPRLRLKVAGDGAASIEFLDEEGQPISSLTPPSSPPDDA